MKHAFRLAENLWAPQMRLVVSSQLAVREEGWEEEVEPQISRITQISGAEKLYRRGGNGLHTGFVRKVFAGNASAPFLNSV
jgi:hypothetical protein